jgi:MFS family permease
MNARPHGRPVGRPRRRGGLDSWRSAEFRALWWAEAVSLVGDQLTRIALSVLVFDRTASTALTALTYAMTFLPDAISGPLLSGLADRCPRRGLMVVCCGIQASLIAAIAIPGLPIGVIAAFTATSAFVQAPYRAAQSACVAVVASESTETYGVANASMVLMRETGQLAGLAGAGVAIAALGVTPALLLDAASFLFAGGLVAGRLERRPAPRPRTGPRVRSQPDPRRRPLVTFTLLCALTVLPFGLAVPLVAQLGAPRWATGLLLAADPAGMVIAGHLARRHLTLARQQVWMGPLAIVSLAAMIPMALARHWLVCAALLFLSGAAAIYTITAKTLFMGTLPDGSRGFAAGLVRAGLRVSQGLVLLAGGWIADLTGSAAQTISGTGLLGATACLVTALSWRRVRHLPATNLANPVKNPVRGPVALSMHDAPSRPGAGRTSERET